MDIYIYMDVYMDVFMDIYIYVYMYRMLIAKSTKVEGYNF